MHQMFSDWYRTVQPTADRQAIERRWAATEECLSSLTTKQVTDLARYIAGRATSQSVEWMRAVYKSHDDVMPTRDIDEEMRVLAGVVLRLALERGTGNASTASLALLTAAFGMKDEPKWLGEHLAAAARHLSTAGRSARERSQALTVSDANPESINGALSDVQRLIDSLSESNDALWWAFSKHSRLLTDSYSRLGMPIAALAAPIDAFESVKIIPPAPEFETLLLHIVLEASLSTDTSFSLRNYASGLGAERAKRLAHSVPSDCEALCPVMWMISVLAKDHKSWMTDFDKLFKFKLTTTFPVTAVSIQLFRELCLTRAFSEQA